MKNSAASLRQRLLNLSRERRGAFDFTLKQFVIQRLLYRLSVSDYKEQFLLKGAILFLVWTGDLHRPTKDIDLLGFGQNDVDVLVADLKSICGLAADDGLIFDIDSIQGSQIKENSLYQGVRITGFANLDTARVSFQVDIGFGDATLAIFKDEFTQNDLKQKQWAAFLQKNRLSSHTSFADVMRQLQLFLEPVYQAASQNQRFDCYWQVASCQWSSSRTDV